MTRRTRRGGGRAVDRAPAHSSTVAALAGDRRADAEGAGPERDDRRRAGRDPHGRVQAIPVCGAGDLDPAVGPRGARPRPRAPGRRRGATVSVRGDPEPVARVREQHDRRARRRCAREPRRHGAPRLGRGDRARRLGAAPAARRRDGPGARARPASRRDRPPPRPARRAAPAPPPRRAPRASAPPPPPPPRPRPGSGLDFGTFRRRASAPPPELSGSQGLTPVRGGGRRGCPRGWRGGRRGAPRSRRPRGAPGTRPRSAR